MAAEPGVGEEVAEGEFGEDFRRTDPEDSGSPGGLQSWGVTSGNLPVQSSFPEGDPRGGPRWRLGGQRRGSGLGDPGRRCRGSGANAVRAFKKDRLEGERSPQMQEDDVVSQRWPGLSCAEGPVW